MHSQAETSGLKLPKVHGVEKGLNLNLRPEKQHTIPKQGKSERLQIGQGRAGRNLIPSTNHQMCCKKFKEELK